jgi:hypothetical protein
MIALARWLICFATICFASIVFSGSPAIGSDSGDRQRIFIKALELFDDAKKPEDYLESARLFESILKDGFQSGVVYYNLGNAYYRAGEYGRAILNYRKAKLFRPRDPYLAANLQQAISMAPGRLVDQPKPWWNHVLFWNEWISNATKIGLVGFGLSLASVFAFCAVWFRRRVFTWLAVATVVVFGAIGVDVAINSPDISGVKRAVIVGETIARKGTGNNYEPAFDKALMDGAELTILSETADWTFGHFEGVGDGWVRNEFVAK